MCVPCNMTHARVCRVPWLIHACTVTCIIHKSRRYFTYHMSACVPCHFCAYHDSSIRVPWRASHRNSGGALHFTWANADIARNKVKRCSRSLKVTTQVFFSLSFAFLLCVLYALLYTFYIYIDLCRSMYIYEQSLAESYHTGVFSCLSCPFFCLLVSRTICTNIYIYTYIYIYVYTRRCVRVCVCVCMWVCVCVWCVCVCVCVWMYAYIYIWICIYVYNCIIFTYMYVFQAGYISEQPVLTWPIPTTSN